MQNNHSLTSPLPAVANGAAALGDATEAARQTLRLLATRRIAPTPDNYRQYYSEITGIKIEEGQAPPPQPDSCTWGPLMADLVKHWEARQTGWTTARKREGLERVLATPNPAVLHNRVRALIQSWSKAAPADGAPFELATPVLTFPDREQKEDVEDATQAKLPPTAPAGEPEIAQSLREWLADALEASVAGCLSGNRNLIDEAQALAARLRRLNGIAELPALSRDLRTFWIRVDRQCNDNSGLRDGVLRLLRLLVENIHELLADDRWLQGQMDVVRRVLSDPEDIQLIEDAERSIKAVIFKQGMLKQSLNEAKSTLKDMVARFIDQLGEVSQNTGAYHDKLGHYSQAIRETEDIGALSGMLDDLMRETRQIQIDTERSREGIIAVHARAEAAEQKVHQLEQELIQASELVREDQLTGILNRRGLEDAMQRELSRAERNRSALCLALLDLDNFKRLNDTHGHQTGDRALVHMVEVVKSTVRPHDIVARYGGEEFLIILPDTEIEEAISVITRVQRNLTKHFFLHNNERLLITFSAGVAALTPCEARDSLIERADGALYQAKAAGKNRVHAAAQDASKAGIDPGI